MDGAAAAEVVEAAAEAEEELEGKCDRPLPPAKTPIDDDSRYFCDTLEGCLAVILCSGYKEVRFPGIDMHKYTLLLELFRLEDGRNSDPTLALAAAIVMAGGLIGTGIAQQGIGAAGMGIIAEKPKSSARSYSS